MSQHLLVQDFARMHVCLSVRDSVCSCIVALMKVTAVRLKATSGNTSWHCQPSLLHPEFHLLHIPLSIFPSLFLLTSFAPSALLSYSSKLLPAPSSFVFTFTFSYLPLLSPAHSHHLPYPISLPHCLHFMSQRSIISLEGKHREMAN